MNVACLLVAGALRAVVPAQEFTVAWTHSVQKTRWEERYRVDGERLRLVEARIQSSGAGMDPPPDATLRGGWWTWQPALPPLPELRLTLSSYTRGYDLCWRERCHSLRRLVSSGAADRDGAVVEIHACREPRHE
jgi:hypothetical protein